jgi:nucleoside-diphosphate-sugar epimerase
MSTLVLGANGAVGFQVVKKLVDDGEAVIAVDIQTDELEKYFGNNDMVHIYWCNLNQALWVNHKNLLTINKTHTITSIINCAAIVDISKSYDETKFINMTLLPILIEIFKKTPMVHISSGSIYSEYDGIIDENLRIKSEKEMCSDYERTKIYAELAALNKYSVSPNLIILRPALIYGPRCGYLGASLASIGTMLSTVLTSTIGFTGGPRTNWVHCEDVARACIWCVDKLYENKGFNIYNVCDDVAHPFGNTVTQYMCLSGLDIKHKIKLPSPQTMKKFKRFIYNDYLPKVVNYPVSKLWDFTKHLNSLDGRLHVSVDKGMLPYLFNNTVFSNDKIKNAGFEIKHPNHHDMIQDTLDWYRTHNWI